MNDPRAADNPGPGARPEGPEPKKRCPKCGEKRGKLPLHIPSCDGDE